MKSIFWFRRDLRLTDNTALNAVLKSGNEVFPIFIFDTEIINELSKNDARIQFIHQQLQLINSQLNELGSGLNVFIGKPEAVFYELVANENITAVYANKDYEPYAKLRDNAIKTQLDQVNVAFHLHKDQVIFEENEILKNDGKPYTIFTPFKNKWLEKMYTQGASTTFSVENAPLKKMAPCKKTFPTLAEIGFEKSSIQVKDINLKMIEQYQELRDFPAKDATSYLSPHLRFGTISIREMAAFAYKINEVFLSELIWREFFMQIIYHFPRVVNENFKTKYNGIDWRNNNEEFKKWCNGQTGYPLVDAGMRELNATGYMHNRVRMVVASFLCKHLLIDWRWGETYFAEKLLDFELSSNNGNWQWAAGTGCDAAPYFRVFNPETQFKKFDPLHNYVQKWVPEWNTAQYTPPIVDHKLARLRALDAYKTGLARE